ncbi:sugar ABC transporter substrate-binding protein [Intrasporangium sp.]|uniref:ABC transporter substrate-binding protein n=1 Tax=Intrasporangium sp. TaxID=1925024 RepID=UPI003221998B
MNTIRTTPGTPRARRRRRIALAAAGAVLAATALAACGHGDSAGGGDGVITYWLWDASQQPGYQKCADAFHAQNPQLTVKITQYGWADYWSKLTAGFIAGTAPDVFTNHVSKYPQFVDLKVLRPLDELGPTKDIDNDDYQPGLAQLWIGQDGHRYGTPKDWDTVAIFYNPAVLKAAGVNPATLDTLTWNPTDGGTFEKLVAHLSVDTKGRRGDEAGFDKEHVKTYGLASDGSGGGGWGQTQWSAFTGSNNWRATDKNPWGTHFNLDEKNFQDAIGWYFGLVRKGFMPTYAATGSGANGVDKQLGSGSAAMGIAGDWMISTYAAMTDADGKNLGIRIAPTPIGPSGHRASMFNGLADSITTLSRQPENAARWVAFLAGAQCQDIIGDSGVVFPARPEGTARAIAYNKKVRHLDVTPFTNHVKDHTTFLFPVTSNGADITALMQPAMDAVYIGSAPVSSLTELNNQLNQLFRIVER